MGTFVLSDLRACGWVGCVCLRSVQEPVYERVWCVYLQMCLGLKVAFLFSWDLNIFGFSSSLNPVGFRDPSCGGVVGDRDLIRALLFLGE